MSDDKSQLVKKIIDHVLEINAGACSITEEKIVGEPDPDFQEILTGLLYLHEDLEHREQQRSHMAKEREAALEKKAAHAKSLQLALESLGLRERKLSLQQERFRVLNRIAIDIMADADLEKLLQVTIDEACKLVEADLGVIVELDQTSGALARTFHKGFPMDRMPKGTQIQGRGVLGMVMGGESIAIGDVTEAKQFVRFPRWHPKIGPCIGVPVAHEGKPLAALLVGRKKGRVPFENADLELIEILSSLAAVAIRNQLQKGDLLRLNRILSEEAATDPLMNIGNRRSFQEAIIRVHAGARRYGTPYGLLMIDVDWFKLFNDNYGHQAGDKVLSQVAKSVSDTIRADDQVFRYGGEELVLIGRVNDTDGLMALGERVRTEIERSDIVHEKSEFKRVTCSLGGAFHPGSTAEDSSPSWESILKEADTALYRAKELGRNRTEI